MKKLVFKKIISLCIKKPELTDLIWDLFFTMEEKVDLEKRYVIVEALLKGDKTQRQMAQDLDVSIAKITRGSNELKRVDSEQLNHLRQAMLQLF